jgi:hypothetical protein
MSFGRLKYVPSAILHPRRCSLLAKDGKILICRTFLEANVAFRRTIVTSHHRSSPGLLVELFAVRSGLFYLLEPDRSRPLKVAQGLLRAYRTAILAGDLEKCGFKGGLRCVQLCCCC